MARASSSVRDGPSSAIVASRSATVALLRSSGVGTRGETTRPSGRGLPARAFHKNLTKLLYDLGTPSIMASGKIPVHGSFHLDGKVNPVKPFLLRLAPARMAVLFAFHAFVFAAC